MDRTLVRLDDFGNAIASMAAFEAQAASPSTATVEAR